MGNAIEQNDPFHAIGFSPSKARAIASEFLIHSLDIPLLLLLKLSVTAFLFRYAIALQQIGKINTTPSLKTQITPLSRWEHLSSQLIHHPNY
ncbi:MAG: hypothetical protein EA367_07850 [Leptolyngbya sp. DLM2.Bin15]|nr:MAG: hypothetical protein EA367_07850 [Leptolyngbya sp. DLM2.Bin15]